MRRALAIATLLVVAGGLLGCVESGDDAPVRVVRARPPAPEPEPEPGSGATVPPPREPPKPRPPRIDCASVKQRGYRKGKGFPIEVITVDGRPVERKTARAYLAMRRAAAEDGVSLPLYSGFRTHDEQKYFYRCYKTCSCNSCSKAARPGHSNHQSGRALDIGLWEGTEPWLREHAKEYGFRPTVRREPWHWEFNGSRRVLKRLPELCVDAKD